jgi:hypothetical protein
MRVVRKRNWRLVIVGLVLLLAAVAFFDGNHRAKIE